MKRLVIVLFLLIFELFSGTANAQQLPVLLMLQRAEQVDTSGCNFVEQVTALVYEEIIANRVKLWDSQKKEIQITGTTLKEIEKHSSVSFVNQETIFMYEYWENNKKEIVTQTLGFSFIHRGNTAEEVAFGYVDYNDLKELFLKTRINSNASGIYSATGKSIELMETKLLNLVGGDRVANLIFTGHSLGGIFSLAMMAVIIPPFFPTGELSYCTATDAICTCFPWVGDGWI